MRGARVRGGFPVIQGFLAMHLQSYSDNTAGMASRLHHNFRPDLDARRSTVSAGWR